MAIMVTQEMIRDEFSSEEFEGTSSSLPYLQMSNNQDPKKCGVFLSLEKAEECGFVPDKNWRQFTLSFASGETAEGYLTSSPRFVVVRRGELLICDRENDRNIVGLFDRDKPNNYDKNIHILKTRFMVFVVGADNKPLHNTPLQFTAKGAFSGDFGSNYTKFRTALSNAYGKANGTSKPRGDKFLALGVMAFHVEPTLKGDKKKSWTSGISNVELPTAENWKDYFVGYDEPTKLLVYSAFDGSESFGTLSTLLREKETDADDGYGLPPVPTKPTMSVVDYLKSVAAESGIPWDSAADALKGSGKFKGVRPSEFTTEQVEEATGIIQELATTPDDEFDQVALDGIPF